MTLVFAGGYTAGHVTPGLAVIEWLRAHHAGCDFVFMGAQNGWERELVTQAGVPFVGLSTVPWAGQPAATRAATLARLPPAVFTARRHLRRVGATVVIGLGSFATVAPALAARTLGLPVILYEPNATLGLANRLLLSSARGLLVSRLFGAAISCTSAARVEVGVPLRARVMELARASRRPFPSPHSPRLLVLGGSRGNPFLNEQMPALAKHLSPATPGLSITHQCGHDVEPASLVAAYVSAGVAANVQSYLDPIAPHFQSADFVVSAAGAISLHELAAAGVPALVVPLDSGGAAHQRHNATAFTWLTGCPHVRRSAWDSTRVAAIVAGVLNDTSRWRQQQAGLRALPAVDATAAFARAVFEKLTPRRPP